MRCLILLFASSSSDGTMIRLISPALLHIFDQTMSMVPFATRTDMYDALKVADVKASAVENFLSNLLLEHSQPTSQAQLRRLWIEHAKDMYPVDDKEDDVAAATSVSAAMPTPPATPPG